MLSCFRIELRFIKFYIRLRMVLELLWLSRFFEGVGLCWDIELYRWLCILGYFFWKRLFFLFLVMSFIWGYVFKFWLVFF